MRNESPGQRRLNPFGLNVSQFKEERTMTYKKPEITHFGDALSTIQGFGKPGGYSFDVVLWMLFPSSISAYEADE